MIGEAEELSWQCLFHADEQSILTKNIKQKDSCFVGFDEWRMKLLHRSV